MALQPDFLGSYMNVEVQIFLWSEDFQANNNIISFIAFLLQVWDTLRTL